MTDQFFTPENIAASLMVGLTTDTFKVVADFAIGDGSLIRALPFTPKLSIGLDLDGNVINALKNTFPQWKLYHGDFLNPDLKTSKWLKKWEQKVDLVLLNPPFSCRGGSHVSVDINRETLKCRTALAFVVKALGYLKEDGILVAILPLSVLKSERDINILGQLKDNWRISTGTKLGRNSFPGCSPNSVVLTMQKKNNSTRTVQPIEKTYAPSLIKGFILRGSTPMHLTVEHGDYPVLHTTNIKQQALSLEKQRFSNRLARFAKGTYLIIPRVGNPTLDKIAIISTSNEMVLSDCLFAISCKNFQSLIFIKRMLMANWAEFQLFYESTCAPYITLDQITQFFAKYAIHLKTVDRIQTEIFTSQQMSESELQLYEDVISVN